MTRTEYSEAQTAERAWVAANYSDESKRRVANGEEATPEDQAKLVRHYAAVDPVRARLVVLRDDAEERSSMFGPRDSGRHYYSGMAAAYAEAINSLDRR